MARKFANTSCVYCGVRPSTAKGDHVFAREFFLVERRGNLPAVPACQACNKRKSDLEHYLVTVLAFGGRHTDAAANLERKGARRPANNRSLHRKLAAGMTRAWTREGGVYLPASALPFEPKKLAELCAFIGRGLAWHHWRVPVTPPDAGVWSSILTCTGEGLFTNCMTAAKIRCSCDLGGGTFSYEGARAPRNRTMWLLSVHGVEFAAEPDGTPSKVGIITGSKVFINPFQHDPTA